MRTSCNTSLEPCDFFGEQGMRIAQMALLAARPWSPCPLGKDLWTIHCIILGMTVGACMLRAILAFTMLAILLA